MCSDFSYRLRRLAQLPFDKMTAIPDSLHASGRLIILHLCLMKFHQFWGETEVILYCTHMFHNKDVAASYIRISKCFFSDLSLEEAKPVAL